MLVAVFDRNHQPPVPQRFHVALHRGAVIADEGGTVGGALLSDLLELPVQGLQAGMVLPNRTAFIQIGKDRLFEGDEGGIDPQTDQFPQSFFFISKKIIKQLFGGLKIAGKIQKTGAIRRGSRFTEAIHHIGD